MEQASEEGEGRGEQEDDDQESDSMEDDGVKPRRGRPARGPRVSPGAFSDAMMKQFTTWVTARKVG